MSLRPVAFAFALVCIQPASLGQVLTVEQVATFGEMDPSVADADADTDVVTDADADASEDVETIIQLYWLSDELILIISEDPQMRYARCIRSEDGTEVWRRVFEGDLFE